VLRGIRILTEKGLKKASLVKSDQANDLAILRAE
jgi:hypothetical protein